jgi:hypothetical protein
MRSVNNEKCFKLDILPLQNFPDFASLLAIFPRFNLFLGLFLNLKDTIEWSPPVGVYAAARHTLIGRAGRFCLTPFLPRAEEQSA